jgi:general secretion pathway protein M
MILSQQWDRLQQRWIGIAARERRALVTAVVLVLAAVIWFFIVSPALATLRTADSQARLLDSQIQQMQSLQSQARKLQNQPTFSREEALKALTLATQQTLGVTADMAVNGERVTITLKAASADSFARWLGQARLNARSMPMEARLTRAAAATEATWSGVLVMALPQQ